MDLGKATRGFRRAVAISSVGAALLWGHYLHCNAPTRLVHELHAHACALNSEVFLCFCCGC